jgi:uncharacterized protein YbaP (TraB family)
MADAGVFWSLHKDGAHAGYLLGTIHSEDPRVLEFTDTFIEALNGCSQFAMELVPDLPTLARLAGLMNLEEGVTLTSVIGQQRFEAVAAALGNYGIPRFMAERMKPWAAMITLSVPAPRTGFFMDFSLSLRASGQGLKVIGLETLDEQLAFLENMPLEHQLTMLDQAVRDADKVTETFEQMVQIYLSGSLEALQAETEEQLQGLGKAAQDYFMQQGIAARNQLMLERAVAALGDGTLFIAVGALHLPGPEGLIRLLEKQGYELVSMPSPFVYRIEAQTAFSE